MKNVVFKHFADDSQNLEIEKAINFVREFPTSDMVLNLDFAYGTVDILTHVMADHSTVVAAVLYPFIKTQTIQFSQLEAFGESVVGILKSVLKIEELKINTKEAQTQNIKDMFIALAKDIRVIILKLAIELENVLLIDKFDKKQRHEIMHQVREIYAPLAAMIGIGYIKTAMENNLFLYSEPLEYAILNKQLHKYVEERNEQILLSIENIKKEIQPTKAQVFGRQKQISSIYKKIQDKSTELNKIYDILAVRVIVDTVEDCYTVLGKVHALYKPLGKFKDYIAQPKENGYQSLHTTVIVENEDPLEIQIRTTDMHAYAEYGFAAHWAYKEKRKVKESDQKISYIRSVMELYKEKSADELLDALKIDVYSGNIFCQTPMGKILQFPEGATPIDFAYAVHSKVGDTCVGAKVNEKMVPLTYKLKNGDIVEIITNNNSKGPSRDWLKVVKTSEARAKINSFFRREMKDENIKRGKSILENSAKAKSINLSRLMKEDYLEELYDRYSLTSADDMYASIGYGGLTAQQVLSRLTNLYNEYNTEQNLPVINPQKIKSSKQNTSAVDVLGYTNLMVKFAKCCNPLPGDEIVGYVSRGKGVTVHRKLCEGLKNVEDERLIECSWNEKSADSFNGTLTIIAVNTPTSISTISRKIGDLKINITSMKTLAQNKEQMTIWLGVNVKNKEELNDLMAKINQLSLVIDVFRTV